MLSVILWTIVFSITTAFSITLLGDRSLISGNLFSLEGLLNLFFNWKFILSMFFALSARIAFILVNNSILKIPRFEVNATTITAFVTAIAYVFVIISNYFFLGERINLNQGIGASIMLLGMFILFK